MGRTKRERKKKKIKKEQRDMFKIIDLQKTLKIKCPKIKVHYFNNTGWGMKCKININKGDILIALPLHHVITPDVQCDIFRAIKRENLSPQFILSLFLIYELHLDTESSHFNYISTLPKAYTNLYFCTKEEVKVLPEFLREELLIQKLNVEKCLNLLFDLTNGKTCNHCSEKLENIFNSEKFEWAWFSVNTRSVYYQDNENFKSMALAPFLDMFNHSNDAETEMSIDKQNNIYVLKTLVKCKKFDQVFIKYGAHSNLKLLLEYGFILPNNENDFVEFSLNEIIKSAEVIDSEFGKLTKLKQNFIQSNKLNHTLIKSKEFFSWNFNALACVLITKDDDKFTLQSKIYSNSLTSAEKAMIQKIGDAVASKKLNELKQNLIIMGKVKNCTVSFQMAKSLVEIYMRLLSTTIF